MADTVADGKTLVYWLPSCAVITAPTVAEFTAGTNLTTQITPDGMTGWEADTAKVDNSSLASTTDTEKIGRDALTDPRLKFKRQMPTDTTRTTLARNVEGFIAIRRDIAVATAIAAGQAVQVVPVECGRRRDLAPEKNTLSRFEVPFANHTTPAYDAVVA